MGMKRRRAVIVDDHFVAILGRGDQEPLQPFIRRSHRREPPDHTDASRAFLGADRRLNLGHIAEFADRLMYAS